MKPITLSIAFATIAAAQRPAFEVASLKPSTSGVNGVRGGCHGIDSRFDANETAPPLGRCVITDGRLSHMIGIAFRVLSMELIRGGPDWVMAGDDRFTVQAKAENPEKATENELLTMLQDLLVDRFQMKFHREEKTRQGYALVIDKGGPKLKASVSESTAMGFGPSKKPRPGEPAILNARKVSMAMLARTLTQVGHGPVSDETGLEGMYDFRLSWDFVDALRVDSDSDGRGRITSGQSIFTSIRQQLGLRLEPRKVPVSYFVIDTAQKPKEN